MTSLWQFYYDVTISNATPPLYIYPIATATDYIGFSYIGEKTGLLVERLPLLQKIGT